MKPIFKNFIIIFFLPLLLSRRLYFWHFADKSKLPGKEFAEYGFSVGWKLLFKAKLSPRLLLNPVSIVRYFEFDFAKKFSQLKDGMKILDISSPYLFGFYQASRFSLEYLYTNPDGKDLQNVNSLSQRLTFRSNYKTEQVNALDIPYQEKYFDRIFSISVIEHILNDGDSLVMKELWRVLKPGGVFILTIPAKNKFEIEYKEKDEYNLHSGKKLDKYFFQRIYDKENIEERLLSSINNYEIISIKVFGCTEKNFYPDYNKRWVNYSYWETTKDPYYISKIFTYFNDTANLVDIGVAGIAIRKLK